MESDWLRQATRYRYTFPVLAELQRDQGCKFVTLMRRLGASDRAIRQALDCLIDAGWAARNPGYGHPLRPEYILVKPALPILKVWDSLKEWNEQGIALERWPLIVLRAIAGGRKRFSQIQQECHGVSPRALALALSALSDSGLATRSLVESKPPTAEYSLTNWGQRIVHELSV